MWDFIYKVDYGPLVCTILGTLFILSGTIWANILSSNKEKIVNEKNEKIIQLTEESKHFITGGDSYPYVMPSIVVKSRQKERKVIGFRISNSNSKYPLYDVRIEIFDLDKFSEIVESTRTDDVNKKGEVFREASREATIFLELGDLGPNQAFSEQIEFEMPLSVKERAFRIMTSARNGNTTQEVKFVRESDEKIKIEEELFVHGKKIER